VLRLAIVVAFDALGYSFQKGVLLGVLDNLDHAMVDGPGGATDAAFHDVLIELFSVQMQVSMFLILADRALHFLAPFRRTSSQHVYTN
jgi:hypothetical protein